MKIYGKDSKTSYKGQEWSQQVREQIARKRKRWRVFWRKEQNKSLKNRESRERLEKIKAAKQKTQKEFTKKMKKNCRKYQNFSLRCW